MKLHYNVGDAVFLNGRWVTVTLLHSGYYDYSYTAEDEHGETVYFSDEDIDESK